MSTPIDKIIQEAAEKLRPFGTHWPINAPAWYDAKTEWQAQIEADCVVIRQAIADAINATGIVKAAQPFAKYACSEPHVGEPECANCVLRTALTQLRALTETNKPRSLAEIEADKLEVLLEANDPDLEENQPRGLCAD